MNLECNLYASMIGSFGIILIGYFFGRCRIITQAQGKGISLYMVKIALPALIFKSLVTVEFSKVNWMLWGGIFIAKAIMFLIVVVLTIIFQKEDKLGKAGLYAIFVTQSNDFAFGLPIIESIFSSPGEKYLVDYLYLVAPISLALLNPIGFTMMEFEKAKKETSDSNNENKYSKTNAQLIGRTLLSTLKGIVTNPLVFMIVVGVVFNFIFHQQIPMLISIFLNNIAQSFGAIALFYLGWCLGSKETSLKGLGYLLPIVLVFAKGILLPIIMRATVSSLVRPPVLNGTHTNLTNFNTQTDFGFIYGSIPTAPPVVVYASMYGLPEDVVASGLVFGTVLCAPILFASIQMMRVLNMKDIDDFCRMITTASKDVSILNIVCCFWLLCVFIILQLYKRKPHCYTMVLIIFQLIIGFIGSFYTKYCAIMDPIAIKILHWLLMTVMHGYCAWTIVIAISLAYVLTPLHKKIMRWIVPIAIIVPFLIATVVVFAYPEMTSKPLVTPYFVISCDKSSKKLGVGITYVVMNVLLLLAVVFSLIKINRRSLFENVFSKKTKLKVEETDPLIENSDQLTPTSSGTFSADFSYGSQSSDQIMNYSVLADVKEVEKMQLANFGYINMFNVANHVILMLIMGFVSILNIAIALWYFVSANNETGLFLELQMLGVVFTFGQGFFTFMTFGFLKELFLLPIFERFYTCCGVFNREKKIMLPDKNQLDVDIVNTCNLFMLYHYDKCVKDIVKDLRFRLNRSRKQVFEGAALVDWLINSGILIDRGEAVAYGNKLLLGRIIKHVSDERFFYDLPYFYEFIPSNVSSSRTGINGDNATNIDNESLPYIAS